MTTHRPPRRSQGFRKAFGQHFLRDEAIAERVARDGLERAIAAKATKLLEVGPGSGALTDHLLKLKNPQLPLLLIERDRELAERWKVAAVSGLAISDALSAESIDFMDWAESGAMARWLDGDTTGELGNARVAVIANLPYSVGTAIIDHLARYPAHVVSMTVMLQAEVAQRLRAEPDTKAWGSLSVWVQNRWDVSPGFNVPPRAFSPPPKVQSEVIHLTPRLAPRITNSDASPQAEKIWQHVIKSCFVHRRKMLRSGLPRAGALRKGLVDSGVDDTKRAEALTWPEWEQLFQATLQAAQSEHA